MAKTQGKECKMKWFSVLKIVWQYMNGKKTNAGTITMLVGLAGIFLPMLGVEIDAETLNTVITAIVSSGAFASLIGLIHKFIKKGKQG